MFCDIFRQYFHVRKFGLRVVDECLIFNYVSMFVRLLDVFQLDLLFATQNIWAAFIMQTG